ALLRLRCEALLRLRCEALLRSGVLLRGLLGRVLLLWRLLRSVLLLRCLLRSVLLLRRLLGRVLPRLWRLLRSVLLLGGRLRSVRRLGGLLGRVLPRLWRLLLRRGRRLLSGLGVRVRLRVLGPRRAVPPAQHLWIAWVLIPPRRRTRHGPDPNCTCCQFVFKRAKSMCVG